MTPLMPRVELANLDRPGYRAALEHQQSIYRYIKSLAQAAEISQGK